MTEARPLEFRGELRLVDRLHAVTMFHRAYTTSAGSAAEWLG